MLPLGVDSGGPAQDEIPPGIFWTQSIIWLPLTVMADPTGINGFWIEFALIILIFYLLTLI